MTSAFNMLGEAVLSKDVADTETVDYIEVASKNSSKKTKYLVK